MYFYLRIISLLLLVFPLSLFGQISVSTRVLESGSNVPLAFVTVYVEGTRTGGYTDIDGYITLNDVQPNEDIHFKYIGYHDILMKASAIQPTMLMRPMEVSTQEVVILPGVNPAERIIRAAIENKKKNDPESEYAFTYDSYNKLIFGGELDSTIANNPDSIAKLDSADRETYDFFNNQHLFLIESIAQRKFLPPNHSEETIIANRVSGLKNPDFFMLATQLQSFSFYGESVEILGTSYMSPLADGAIKKYLFILEDTTFQDNDTVFTISFRPRRGKNFVGMKGSLYINTHGYALQNVLAEPAEEGGFYIRIQQKYQFAQGVKWFPDQLNSFISFPMMIVNNVPIIGEGRSYIKNLKLDVPLKRSEFTPVTLILAKDASNVADSVWNKYRDRPLELKELETYRVIDSVGKAENLDLKLKLFESLTTGLVPIGPVSLELSRLLRANSYEGLRLGAGLRTNYKLSEKYSLGAYYAYGFKDKHSKYGGDIMLHLYRKRSFWLKAIYENDVMETGGNQFNPPGESFLRGNLYPIFISQMDRREKWEAQLHSRIIGNLSLQLFANKQFVRVFDGKDFIYTENENTQVLLDRFDLFETGIIARFAPGEKLVHTKEKEVRLFGYYPLFYVRATRGFKGPLDGDIQYTRVEAQISKTFKILNAGEMKFELNGGWTSDPLPLSLLYNARGTNNLDYSNRRYLGIAAPGNFETMRTNEFQHSRFVALHFRHNFKDLLLKTEKFNPGFSIVHNMLWGELEHPEKLTEEARSAKLGYFESGLQVDNLLKSGFSSFGLGFFYRYGPYHLPTFGENFAVKLSSTIAF